MSHSCKVLTTIASTWLFMSGVLCLPAAGREVKLAIRPQKMPSEPGKWVLLPPEESLIDGDAVAFYEKAVQALPGTDDDGKIREWLAMPLDQLPTEQVQQVLMKYRQSLRNAARAARCRQCNWPEWKPGMELANLTEYRRIAFAVALWARLEIATGGYEGAVLALQTGFGMARQIGHAPTLVQTLVGIAIGGVMSGEIEELAQGDDSPNLYLALASLPRPFIEIEKAIENDIKAALSGPAGALSSDQIETMVKPGHDRVRAIAKRLDTHLAALQCVETIRSYAAAHRGQLPGTLAEITEVSVPQDPVMDEPFRYVRTGSTAVLESSIPADGNEKDRIRYEIAVKN